jgi:hypothetical protein
MDMREVARKFQQKHCKQGLVTKVTDYSLTFETQEKESKTKSTIYMKSYFWNREV